MNEVLDVIFILNFTNRQYVSLFSLRWTSPALTWASRNIIPMSTTRLIATCWTLKCNHFHILLSIEVVIKWSFFPWYTDCPPPPTLPHAFQSFTAIFTLITCLNVSTACQFLVVKKKNSSEIANHFYNKGTEKSFKLCFVYSVFICRAALMSVDVKRIKGIVRGSRVLAVSFHVCWCINYHIFLCLSFTCGLCFSVSLETITDVCF